MKIDEGNLKMLRKPINEQSYWTCKSSINTQRKSTKCLVRAGRMKSYKLPAFTGHFQIAKKMIKTSPLTILPSQVVKCFMLLAFSFVGWLQDCWYIGN